MVVIMTGAVPTKVLVFLLRNVNMKVHIIKPIKLGLLANQLVGLVAGVRQH